jgi:hypothetical protein
MAGDDDSGDSLRPLPGESLRACAWPMDSETDDPRVGAQALPPRVLTDIAWPRRVASLRLQRAARRTGAHDRAAVKSFSTRSIP